MEKVFDMRKYREQQQLFGFVSKLGCLRIQMDILYDIDGHNKIWLHRTGVQISVHSGP